MGVGGVRRKGLTYTFGLQATAVEPTSFRHDERLMPPRPAAASLRSVPVAHLTNH